MKLRNIFPTISLTHMGSASMDSHVLSLIGCITHEMGALDNWLFVHSVPDRLRECPHPLADH